MNLFIQHFFFKTHSKATECLPCARCPPLAGDITMYEADSPSLIEFRVWGPGPGVQERKLRERDHVRWRLSMMKMTSMTPGQGDSRCVGMGSLQEGSSGGPFRGGGSQMIQGLEHSSQRESEKQTS